MEAFLKAQEKKYPYYHCKGKCKTRIRATLLNDYYEQEIQQLILSDKAIDLFNCVLEDWNTTTQKAGYLQERQQVVKKLKEQELILSQARKLFVSAILKIDDYTELKREYQISSKCLKRELRDINVKLCNIDKQRQKGGRSITNILHGFAEMDTADKKHLVSLISPHKVNPLTKTISLELNSALTKILLTKQ